MDSAITVAKVSLSICDRSHVAKRTCSLHSKAHPFKRQAMSKPSRDGFVSSVPNKASVVVTIVVCYVESPGCARFGVARDLARCI